jgi:hypothetical protein
MTEELPDSPGTMSSPERKDWRDGRRAGLAIDVFSWTLIGVGCTVVLAPLLLVAVGAAYYGVDCWQAANGSDLAKTREAQLTPPGVTVIGAAEVDDETCGPLESLGSSGADFSRTFATSASSEELQAFYESNLDHSWTPAFSGERGFGFIREKAGNHDRISVSVERDEVRFLFSRTRPPWDPRPGW